MKPWQEKAQPLGDKALQELYDAGNEHTFEVFDALQNTIANYDGKFK